MAKQSVTTKRTALALTVSASALVWASPALAACAIAPGGTGTVANPGPNSVVECTGTTTGINVATSSPAAAVQVYAGAQVNGVSGSEIFMDGGFNTVQIGAGPTSGSAALFDTNIVILGDHAGLYLIDGSQIQSPSQPTNQIIVQGANAVINIGPGSQILATRPVQLSGGGASFGLEAYGLLRADASFTGSALILGGATGDVYQLGGRIEVLGNNSAATVLDAGDGDDVVYVGPLAVFADVGGVNSTSTFVLDGGGGDDTMYLTGSSNRGPFSSVGIEHLVTAFGSTDEWTLQGVHEFQEVRVVTGKLTALGTGALGVAGSNVNILTDGRLYYFASGLLPFSHNLQGDGIFEFAGSTEFSTANTGFSGTFLVSGGVPVISHDQAFGSADVVVDPGAYVELRDVTIANSLSGGGTYFIQGALSSLTGTNAMTGLIIVNSGALVVGNLAALGNGQVAMPAPIELHGSLGLNLNQFSSGTLNNALSGAGTLTKAMIGELTINRSNPNFTGQVNLLGGRTYLNADNALGTGTINFGGGALNSGDVLIANNLTGTGSIEKNGSGITQLTGNNSTLAGTIIVNAGTLRATSAAALGQTGVVLSNVGTLDIDIATGAATMTNSLSGGGTLRKSGAGQLNLTNPFTVGALAASAGQVRVNTTVTTNATVATGAALDGTGRIIGNLTNNGTVAPGNSIGTLTVQGNYVHNAGSVLEIEFDGNGGIDLLAVTGSVTLNGGTLRFISLGGAEGSGGTFLTAGGGVTGTFATIETVGAQLPLAVIYQTNSAIMAPSVLTARPSTFNSQFLAAADTALGFIDRIAGEAARRTDSKRLWLQGFGASGNRSASGSTLAYGHDSHGLGGGLTVPLGDNAVVGVGIGWAHGDIDLASNGGGGDQDSVLGSLYARVGGGDGLAFSGGLVFGKTDQATLRNVSFNGFSASVSGDTKSSLFGAFFGMDVPLAAANEWSFAGNLRASLIHQSQDAYAEDGTSPLRLALGKQNVDTLEGQAGISARRSSGKLDLRFDLGARYLGAMGDRLIPVAFAATNAAITLQGDTRDGVAGFGNIGLDYAVSPNVTLSLGYAGQVGASDRHEGRVGLAVGF